MAFFLLLLLLDKNFSFTGAKTGRVLAACHIGLNLTAVMLMVRGMSLVLETMLSSGMNAQSPVLPGLRISSWEPA